MWLQMFGNWFYDGNMSAPWFELLEWRTATIPIMKISGHGCLKKTVGASMTEQPSLAQRSTASKRTRKAASGKCDAHTDCDGGRPQKVRTHIPIIESVPKHLKSHSPDRWLPPVFYNGLWYFIVSSHTLKTAPITFCLTRRNTGYSMYIHVHLSFYFVYIYPIYIIYIYTHILFSLKHIAYNHDISLCFQ